MMRYCLLTATAPSRTNRFQSSILALGGLILLSPPALYAADFTVTTPIYDYIINDQQDMNNPTITLERGRTYTFAINVSSGHPFAIGSFNQFGSPYDPGQPGITYDPPEPFQGAGIYSGTVTFAISASTTNCGYFCTAHGFYGLINIVDAPEEPPPVIQIVGLTLGTNLVLTSTGTNTWAMIPEYSTNAAETNWYALTVQTNRFENGTNEIICGTPPGDSVLVRIRAQQLE